MLDQELKRKLRHIDLDTHNPRRYLYYRHDGDRAPGRILLPYEPTPAQQQHIRSIRRKSRPRVRPAPEHVPFYGRGKWHEILWLIGDVLGMLIGYRNPYQ